MRKVWYAGSRQVEKLEGIGFWRGQLLRHHTHTHVARLARTQAKLLRAAAGFCFSARTRQPLGLGSQPSRANLVTDRDVHGRGSTGGDGWLAAEAA
jgi:hypothetical protein